jgi:hypothetical protein
MGKNSNTVIWTPKIVGDLEEFENRRQTNFANEYI